MFKIFLRHILAYLIFFFSISLIIVVILNQKNNKILGNYYASIFLFILKIFTRTSKSSFVKNKVLFANKHISILENKNVLQAYMYFPLKF